MAILDNEPVTAASFGKEPLYVLPNNKVVDLASGYIPLLASFTFEDKAAKGLRKRGAETSPEPPVYFSALELVRDHRVLLLSGPTGSGKTTFAKHLCFRLASTGFDKALAVVRNELGQVHEEIWAAANVVPYYFNIDSPQTLQSWSESTLPQLIESWARQAPETNAEALVILDGIERASDHAISLLETVIGLVEENNKIRLLVLGETEVLNRKALPAGIVRHEILPLLKVQRQRVFKLTPGLDSIEASIGAGKAATNPALFAMSLESGDPGDQAEEVLDAWLAKISLSGRSVDNIPAQAFKAIASEQFTAYELGSLRLSELGSPTLFSSRGVQELLAARHLETLDLEDAIRLFRSDPLKWKSVIRSLLIRTRVSGKVLQLAEGLIRGSGEDAQRGALLVSDIVEDIPELEELIRDHLLIIIEHGTLSAIERERAGRILSKLGDPRDLTTLTKVPAGTFTLGSDNHPNSQPLALITLKSFSIGLYPVVNRDYALFVKETGRKWLSPDGFASDRQNAPATDVTWHDAWAYCSWLTNHWRAGGRIATHERVRLPSEPEWERASRGQQDEPGVDGLVYPWGTKWVNDAANSEEAGFNKTCTVGLFPRGRSPYGCFDMTGHVWEWCTTLWGEDMATPSFQYPWREDGREALDAPGSIRRVLRGGCFSTGKLKATCTYRGSLEPDGFWRGNGFRVVVAAD